MFLGLIGGEGGEDTEVATEVGIVVGTGTAPIEHVAGELFTSTFCTSSSGGNHRGRGRGY
jgi:hypothetical protein